MDSNKWIVYTDINEKSNAFPNLYGFHSTAIIRNFRSDEQTRFFA